MADILDRQVPTPVGEAPLIPLALIIAGGYLAWFGVRYWDSDTKWPTDPIKAVLTGKPLPTPDRSGRQQALQGALGAAQTGAAGATVAAGVNSAAGSVKGLAIANQALSYRGQGYAWGGPADRPGNWDCSSFVSYVLGHDLGYALPGGTWNGPGMPPHAHGPTTIQYQLYGTPVAQSQAQAGDLIVSSEHMGIIVNATQYVSARDPALGTGLSTWPAGFPGGTPVYRRV